MNSPEEKANPMSTLSKEEILRTHIGLLPIIEMSPQRRNVFYAAMDEYAKQEAIKFCLHFVGELSFPKNATHYDERSNEDIIIHLPATIEKRYDLYTKQKQG